MHTPNLVKFYQLVLKILSGNEVWHTSRVITLIQMCKKRHMCNNPKLDLVNMLACLKFGESLSIGS